MEAKVAERLYMVMVELLFMYDPAGLNESCPIDEYAPEANILLAHPEFFESQECLRRAIYEVCANCFGVWNIVPLKDETYAKLAKEFLFAKSVFEESL